MASNTTLESINFLFFKPFIVNNSANNKSQDPDVSF